MNESNIENEFKLTLEKIGRNVLNFQKLETGFKFLIPRCNIHGNKDTLVDNFKIQENKQAKKTMGNLVKEYLDNVYLGVNHVNESAFSLQFSVEADEGFIIERTRALEYLVEQRNLLVHQRLFNLDQTSISSCRKLCSELDEQNEKIKYEFEILKGQALSLIEAGKYLVKDNEKL